MDSERHSLKGLATGPLQGTALLAYFALLPYVVVTKWHFSYTVTDGHLLRYLLAGLSVFWAVFFTLVVVYVGQLRRRRSLPRNGCAWLAGLVIVALPFLVSSSADAATTPAAPATVVHSPTSVPVRAPEGLSSIGVVALALAAKGGRDRLRRGDPHDDYGDLDEFATTLHQGDDSLVARLRDVVGSGLDGEIEVDDTAQLVEPRADLDPVVVANLGERAGRVRLAYAREGGTLRIDAAWGPRELAERVVALHEGGVSFAQSDNELVRALVRRRDPSTIVVFLGHPDEIDDELRDLCVCVRPGPSAATLRAVRVELLRAYPQVQGLVEDFVPTLRRRCLEMVAYLALHAGEPVTGDRLRTRVLVHAQVDASKAVLSNTATAVRRSLGSDERGPLLEPASEGLYHQRGVGLDVADFHRLVARSRRADSSSAPDLYVAALRLVHGEPLASVLKGFEWFTYEGHRAQLQREGEWVALALHEAALDAGDVETAFWAIRQGLLLDPDSEALRDLLDRVPRLREFRGDGAGAAQDQSVRSGRAVAVSWAFERFGR